MSNLHICVVALKLNDTFRLQSNIRCNPAVVFFCLYDNRIAQKHSTIENGIFKYVLSLYHFFN